MDKQELIKEHYKKVHSCNKCFNSAGMGNLTNIFPSQVDKLLIIDKSNNQQKQDVDVIDGSLKKVSDAHNAQESMRQEICELVLNSLA